MILDTSTVVRGDQRPGEGQDYSDLTAVRVVVQDRTYSVCDTSDSSGVNPLHLSNPHGVRSSDPVRASIHGLDWPPLDNNESVAAVLGLRARLGLCVPVRLTLGN